MKVYLNNQTYFMQDGSAIVELTPNQDRYLKLPANSVNRVWVSCAKVDKAPNQCVDYGEDVKVARTLAPRGESTPRKGLEDYLDDEDKALYLALVEKAKANREAANKKAPMTEEEKLRARIARDEARLAALMDKEN